jgi:ribosomal-protein-alanine N-acetyltransferase
MEILQTDRLLLRRLRPDDLDDLAALYADPEVMRFWPRPYSVEETREAIERMTAYYEEHGFGLWATIHKPDGRFLGRCGLLRFVVDGVAETEVAYMIARPEWGRGFATEAARGVSRYAFTQLHVDRLIALIVPDNKASQRVAEKNGMHYERDMIHAGEPHRLYRVEKAHWVQRVAGPAGLHSDSTPEGSR